jgi:hypothetical protein
MGFLDKLLGRTKETAGDVAEKAAPVVDKAQEGASQAWDTTKDAAGDVADKAKDALDRGKDDATDAAADAAPTSGSGPSAA